MVNASMWKPSVENHKVVQPCIPMIATERPNSCLFPQNMPPEPSALTEVLRVGKLGNALHEKRGRLYNIDVWRGVLKETLAHHSRTAGRISDDTTSLLKGTQSSLDKLEQREVRSHKLLASLGTALRSPRCQSIPR